MTHPRRRIDQLLVELGMADSRHKAQALLLAGQVLVNERKVEKPGRMVDPDAAIRILGEMPFVSRAGGKLQAALDHFQIRVAGRICADLGASTGGFTDCLLQNGAAAVHAYDVGVSQLAWKLRTDPRVTIHEHCNVRYITVQDLPPMLSLIAVDLSFISLTKILEPLSAALRECLKLSPAPAAGLQADLIVLVKPQFEVGKAEVGKGGIVRDDQKRLAALARVKEAASAAGFTISGDLRSPVPGAAGNQEFLLCLQLPPVLSSRP